MHCAWDGFFQLERYNCAITMFSVLKSILESIKRTVEITYRLPTDFIYLEIKDYEEND